MQQSSESIATLAAALAKAQAELVNPEKSQTAVIRSGRPGEGERSFRYAPLASGLDIVRKTLSKHEIATMQTTAVDVSIGMVQLTTMLAHSSGEWISSQWPICPVTESANPQRMGAALTYARRYGLFTLVGIAGEDDLDAPDANACEVTGTVGNGAASGHANGTGTLNYHAGEGGNRGRARAGSASDKPVPLILAPQDSAERRQAMLGEISALRSSAEATRWAADALKQKNLLSADDAHAIEIAFTAQLAKLPDGDAEVDRKSASGDNSGDQSDQPAKIHTGQVATADEEMVTRRRPPAAAHPIRHRNKEHLRFVSKQPCLVCGRQPSDPHHLRFAQPRALGRKVSDEFVVPLCRVHHRELHRASNELEWWEKQAMAPLLIAEALWRKTQSGEAAQHPLPLLPEEPRRTRQQKISPREGSGLRDTKMRHRAD